MPRLRPDEREFKVLDVTTTDAYQYGIIGLSRYKECTISIFNKGVNVLTYTIDVSPKVTETTVDWHTIKTATDLNANSSDFETLCKPWAAIRIGVINKVVATPTTARAYVGMDMKQ